MKNPTSHWLHQRITALIMVILLPWFLYYFILSDNQVLTENGILDPVNGLFLFLLLISALYHMVLGLLTIIDDYIHSQKLNHFLKTSIYLKAIAMGLFGATLIILLIQRSL